MSYTMRRIKTFFLIGTLVATLGFAGCSKNDNQLADANGGPVIPGSVRDFQVNVGNIVYFTTDSTQLTSEAQSILSAQAQWMRKYSEYGITLEGHADERGTREYNIALGAKRSETVRRYLVSQGINPARMKTISYGKERPVALCDDISCWSQNRRVVTVLNQRLVS